MAAYAALRSLMNLIEQLQRHPRPPVALDNNQVETLTQKIAFLKEFLEVYNSHYSKPEVERLRNRIADVAHTSEDVIETCIVNRIKDSHRPTADASTICEEENIGSVDLHDVIRDMGFVEKGVLEIKHKLGTQHPQTSVVVASKSNSTEHNTMVGFDDVLNEILDKITRQPHSRRQIIPIFGMGGIGKTTLARNVYVNPLTKYHFDIRSWVTFSREYTIRDILLGVLLCQKSQESWESMSEKSEVEMGEMLYKSLCGKRYLIVMDDMWSHAAWDRVKCFFPNQCNGSRIIVTTRLTNVASYLDNCPGLEMDLLDQDKSWSLFCKIVFGEEHGCPSELENVGKEISRNCKGLPLSIVVLGGLLAKSKQTHEYWEYIAKNLNSIVNLEENERCFKILHASYDQLPAHLKVCFLYLGVFPEDHEIPISQLIGMWVAESFLKPINGKSLEESAEEYLMDLAGRNLIMVHENNDFSRQGKFCNIHDLLRDLCIRVARKEKFIYVANQHSEGLDTQRCIAIHSDTSEKECLDILEGGSTTRSLICYSRDALPLVALSLLRVFTKIDNKYEDRGNYRLEDIFGLVNMRYLSMKYGFRNRVLPSSISQLWNLQTLYVSCESYDVVAPPEIWKLPLIRHIEINGLILPDPPSGHMNGRDDFVLHELHTLVGITNLKLSEEVIKRIPNVNKLELYFNEQYQMPLYLNNLDRLYKLEDLSIKFQQFHPPSRTELIQNLTFPLSLKKLALRETQLQWEDLSTKVGSLPRLQMLIMDRNSFIGPKWETLKGQFFSLKYLQIKICDDLQCWSTKSTHFPCLECLHLEHLDSLEEIPLCIGDIPTLKSIIVQRCSDSVVISAKRILDEQEELGNESLRVRILLDRRNDKSLERLASHNFQIEVSRNLGGFGELVRSLGSFLHF